jgi:surface antigen
MEATREFRPAPVVPIAILAVALVASTGCASLGPKAKSGAVLGSTGGGLIALASGAGAAGIIGGILLGGLAGGAVGDMLDQRDKELAMKATQQSLESARTGESIEWTNPDSGHSGSITPTETYQSADGAYCRKYTQSIIVKDEAVESFGTACRQPDGTWKDAG